MTVKDVRSLYPMMGVTDAVIDYYVRYTFTVCIPNTYLWKITFKLNVDTGYHQLVGMSLLVLFHTLLFLKP